MCGSTGTFSSTFAKPYPIAFMIFPSRITARLTPGIFCSCICARTASSTLADKTSSLDCAYTAALGSKTTHSIAIDLLLFIATLPLPDKTETILEGSTCEPQPSTWAAGDGRFPASGWRSRMKLWSVEFLYWQTRLSSSGECLDCGRRLGPRFQTRTSDG